MPKIERQKPINGRPAARKVRGQKPADDSVLSEAIDVGDLESNYVNMLIYGQNRVGKTTLACQFPKPLLLISLEMGRTGGAKSVRKVSGVKFLAVHDTVTLLKLAGELQESNPFATVVVDTATALQDIILKEILNLDDVPEMMSWGTASRDQYRERSEKTREHLRPFLDLPCHTVITAKERDHNPPDPDKPKVLRSFEVESYLAADLGGATVGWLHDACDYIGRLYLDKERKTVERTVKVAGKTKTRTEEVETGRIVHRLRTLYHPNMAAGFRSENPERVPEFIEGEDPVKMYEEIMRVIGD